MDTYRIYESIQRDTFYANLYSTTFWKKTNHYMNTSKICNLFPQYFHLSAEKIQAPLAAALSQLKTQAFHHVGVIFLQIAISLIYFLVKLSWILLSPFL